MININWTKEIDDTIYQMEFVRNIDKNYLVKFSAVPLDAVEDASSSSSCLVELSSYEIAVCNAHPKDTYMFIKHSEAGLTCYAIDFCHDRSSDPEYKCISRDIHPIYSIDGYINRLHKKPIEHDLNGCVVNTESCVVRTNYFAKNEKSVFEFVENIYHQTVDDIRLWESENCPKSTNEVEETPSETTDDWNPKTWNGYTCIDRSYIWTDGENVYYSYGTDQYVLDKSTSTWLEKTWSGLSNFTGFCIWTDGESVYYSRGSDQYVLDKSTSTWIEKTWSGLSRFYGYEIWIDGENTYYSDYDEQYVLDKSTSTWTAKTWTGITSFLAHHVWSDGDNVYYSRGLEHYVLDKSTSTWVEKTWSGLTSFSGTNVWTDGENVYCSEGTDQYVLNKSTYIWTPKTWSGYTDIYGRQIWTDGENIYYSSESDQYILSGENE